MRRWATVALVVVATARAAAGATVSSIQTGTVDSTANGTTTVTISAVDTTASFLIFQTRSNTNVPPGEYLRGKIATSTTLAFDRVTSETSTVTIRWYVVSFSSGVKVQRGEVDQSAATVNVTITAVAALTQAFVTFSKTPVAGNASLGSDDMVLAELTSTTNLQFRTGAASTGHTLSWQVIEFTNASDINVQKGSLTTLTGTATSVTATLGTAVDTSRAFVLAGYWSSASTAAVGDRMIRAQLTNSTTVTIDRDITGTGNVTRPAAWTTGLSHTPAAGSNRLLVFAVSYENASDIGVSSVSFGGRALTKIVGKVAGTTVFDRVELWYLNEAGIAAASGTTFTVTWGGTAPTDPMYAAATYTGIDQGTPVANSSSNSTELSTPNPLTTTVTAYNRGMAVAAAICGNDGTFTWNNSWTSGGAVSSNTTTNLATGEHLAAVDGTDTASATHSNQNRVALVAAFLNPITEDVDEVLWQVVELKDGATVQGGSQNFPSGTAQQVVTLGTAVDPNRSIAFASVQANGGQNLGRTEFSTDDNEGPGTFTMALTSTQLTIDRIATGDDADVGWFVVQFRPRHVMVCSRPSPTRRLCRAERSRAPTRAG